MIYTMMFLSTGDITDVHKILKLIMMFNKIKGREGVVPPFLLSCISTAHLKKNEDLPARLKMKNDLPDNLKKYNSVVLVQCGVDDDDERCVYFTRMIEWFNKKRVCIEDYDENCDEWLDYTRIEDKVNRDMINDIDDYIHKMTITNNE